MAVTSTTQTVSSGVSPSAKGRPWTFYPAAALALAAVALLAALLPRLFTHWQACRDYPFQLDAEEGFILNQALTLAHGGSIYTSLAHPPFLVGNYPPLLPWVYGLAVGARATLASLPEGRALVQASALLAALALCALAALRTRRALPALLAPLLFLASYEVYHWAAFVRVDLPALALTLAGLGVFLAVRPRWGAAAAAAIFVAAGFTRQTALLAPAACAGALLLHDRRRLAWFLIPYAGLGLLAFGVLQARTGGEFYRHVVTYNQNKMDWSGFASVMTHEVWFFYRAWILALVWGALIFAAGQGWRAWNFIRRRGGDSNPEITPLGEGPNVASGGSDLPQASGGSDLRPGRFAELPHTRHAVTFYLILAALSLLSYAKVGAAPNYVLEPLAAAALWTAECLGRLLDRLEGAWRADGRDDGATAASIADCGLRIADCSNAERGVRSAENSIAECGMRIAELSGNKINLRRWGAAVGAWGFCLLLAAHGAQLACLAGQKRFSWSPEPTSADRAAGGELLKAMREAPGDAFCEEPIATLLAGKAVLFQPFIMAQLAREGRWDARPIQGWLESKRFSIFIANDDLTPGAARDYERYTPAMAEALRRNYTPAGCLVLPNLHKPYYLWKAK